MEKTKSLKVMSVGLIIACLLPLVNVSYAGDTADSMPFLRMGIGARAVGMGGAFVSVSDDASAAYWNPGGLGKVEQKEITAMYSLLSLDRSLNWLNFVMPMGFGNMGFSILNSGVGELQGYDENQTATGKFAYQANAVYISYGKSMEESINTGLNLKIITDSMKDTSRVGFGLDLGILASPSDKLSLGLKLQDLIGVVGNDALPLAITAGASYRILKNAILLSADLTKVAEVDSPKISLGMEYSAIELVSIQAGLNDMNFSFGTAFKFGMFKFSYAYAVDPMKIGDRHLVSFGARF